MRWSDITMCTSSCCISRHPSSALWAFSTRNSRRNRSCTESQTLGSSSTIRRQCLVLAMILVGPSTSGLDRAGAACKSRVDVPETRTRARQLALRHWETRARPTKGRHRPCSGTKALWNTRLYHAAGVRSCWTGWGNRGIRLGRLRGLRVLRQQDPEAGPLGLPALDLDPAAMAGNDAVTDRQSQPRAFAHGLGREERIEQPLAMFRVDAGTVVAHGDLDPGADQAPHDLDPPTLLAARALDRLQCVDEQIEQNLANLIGHALDSRHVVNLDRNLDALMFERAAHHLQRVVHQVRERGCFPLRGRGPG